MSRERSAGLEHTEPLSEAGPERTAVVAHAAPAPLSAPKADPKAAATFKPAPAVHSEPKAERKREDPKPLREFNELMTKRFIEAIEKDGLPPWRKPYNVDLALMLPIGNGGRPYRGMNRLVLPFIAEQAGFESNRWLTRNHIDTHGGTIPKGEKPALVVLWKPLFLDADGKVIPPPTKPEKAPAVEAEPLAAERVEDELMPAEDPRLKADKVLWLFRSYAVWNRDQVQGLPPQKEPAASGPEKSPIERADAVIQAYLDAGGPKLQHTLNPFKPAQAWYGPAQDKINVPKLVHFNTPESYYSTLLHELAHSTGAKHRLNREGITDLSSWTKHRETYAKEELVADLASAFLRSRLGIQSPIEDEQTQAYLKGWIKPLKDDSRLLYAAAREAQLAEDFILGMRQKPLT